MVETDIASDYLRTVPPFDSLPDSAVNRAARAIEVAYYRHEQPILNSDESAGLALIRKGAVRLIDEDGRFLDKRSEGELFGHAAWFGGEQQPYRAVAEEDSLVWHLPDTAFTALKGEHPTFAHWFNSSLSGRLNDPAKADRAARTVADLLRRPPVIVERSNTIRSTAALMSEERVSSVLVVDNGTLAGIVTDKDLRRRVVATGQDLEAPISAVMTENPTALPASAAVDDALLTMMRHGYHHLPVVEDSTPVGLITAGDILRSQSEHPLRLLQDIQRQNDIDGLHAVSQRLPALFERMVGLGRDTNQLGKMVTRITDAFTVRLIELAETELGPAPQAWAWVAFGSQGRQEQTAKTDQDNGLITEREISAEDAPWFDAFSEKVCRGLDTLGYVFCPGEIMALNSKWRTSLERWKGHFDRWIDSPEPKAVMHSSIFFDMRCIAGDCQLVQSLADHAVRAAQDNRIFRRFMAANALTHKPPIGFFRRFVQEGDGSQSEGLNLKHRGIVPIVDLIRLRALEAGVREANSIARLEHIRAAEGINEGDAASLEDALRLITRLRLEHQCSQLAAGEAPGNLVPAESLSPLMRRNLKAAFMLVQEAQQALAIRYQVG